MRNGNEVHKLFKEHIQDGYPFTADFVWLQQYVPARTSRTMVLESELPLAIDRDCNPVEFYDPDCWFRGKIDLFNIEADIAFIIDWKTGKPYEDPDELNLHAMLAKAVYPKPKHWRGMYVWLRDKRVGDCHTLSPTQTYRKLLTRVEKLKIEDKPRQNPLCPWCNIESCEFKK